MKDHSYLLKHLLVDWTLVIQNLPAWLEWLKETTGCSWNELAMCLRVDVRRLEDWRKGKKPRGPGMVALVLLAERIPGAHDRLLYPRGRPRAAVVREAAPAPGDFPPFHPPGGKAA